MILIYPNISLWQCRSVFHIFTNIICTYIYIYCIYLYIFIYLYIDIYIYLYIFIYLYIDIYLYIYIVIHFIFIYLYIYIFYIYMFIYLYIHIYIYIHINIYVYIYMYAYAYLFNHVNLRVYHRLDLSFSPYYRGLAGLALVGRALGVGTAGAAHCLDHGAAMPLLNSWVCLGNIW